MAGVRWLSERVRRLEQVRALGSPFDALETWEAECQAGIDEGYLDGRDFTVVMMAVRRWQQDRVWG